MQRLKLASTKIPIELLERLNRYTESTGLTQSAAIRQAIEQFLDSVESTGLTKLTHIEGSSRPSELVARVDAVDDRLTELEARLTQIEARSVSTQPAAPTPPAAPTDPTSPAAPVEPPTPTPTPSNTAPMTTGELFTALKARGYSGGASTLSLKLNQARATRQLPEWLEEYGVVADWQIRENAAPTSNRVRWLRIAQV